MAGGQECQHTNFLRYIGSLLFKEHRNDIQFDRRILDNELSETETTPIDSLTMVHFVTR